MLDYARLMSDYARYHLTPGNQRAHLIGPAFVAEKLVGMR